MHIIIREINQITLAIALKNGTHNIIIRRPTIKINIPQQATKIRNNPDDEKQRITINVNTWETSNNLTQIINAKLVINSRQFYQTKGDYVIATKEISLAVIGR